jgi:hypothetical protein
MYQIVVLSEQKEDPQVLSSDGVDDSELVVPLGTELATPCVDCSDGVLRLGRLPPYWPSAREPHPRRYVYICSNYGSGKCKGTLNANPDGRPRGKQRDAATRAARNRYHRARDKLFAGATNRQKGLVYSYLKLLVGSVHASAWDAATAERAAVLFESQTLEGIEKWHLARRTQPDSASTG